jgi:hypothetical protein
MKTKILLLTSLLVLGISCKKDKPLTAPQIGLISYFNFDDNLKDQKGYASDGIPTGNPTFTDGKRGKALTRNGIDQSVNFKPKNPQNSNQISISCWFKTVDLGFNNLVLDITNPSNKVKIYTSQGEVSLTVSLPNTNSVFVPFLSGQWNHYAGTFDGNTMKVYINGIYIAQKNHPGTIFGFNDNMDLTNDWPGSIDELYIYNRALSQAEVTQLYNLK